MKAKEEADKLRREAKIILSKMFNIPEGYTNMAVERLVDCIIGAAILEVAALQESAQQAVAGDAKSKDFTE